MNDNPSSSRLRVQDVADRLVSAGLEQDDARAFVHLCVHGRLPAGTIAKNLQLSRAASYRILGRLTERGFVIASSDHPTKFSAAPIERVFEDLLAIQRAKVNDLERLQAELMASVEALKAEEPDDEEEGTMRLLRGRRNVYLILELMVREAEKSLRLINTHPAGYSISRRMGAWPQLVERAREGLQVQAVLPEDDALEGPILEADSIEAMHIRQSSDLPPMRLIIMDDRDVLLWVVSEESDRLDVEQEAAVWTNDHAFQRVQAKLFQDTWSTAKKAAVAKE